MSDQAFERGRERCDIGDTPKISSDPLITDCSIPEPPGVLRESPEVALPAPPLLPGCAQIVIGSGVESGSEFDLSVAGGLVPSTQAGQCRFEFDFTLVVPDTEPGLPDGNPPFDLFSSVELVRCSDGLKIYAFDVAVGEDTLLDQAGSVVVMEANALLASSCWQVIGTADRPPDIFPSISSVVDNCSDCVDCVELVLCSDPAEVILASLADMVSAGQVVRGDAVVRLADGLCYEVFPGHSCSNTQPVTVVAVFDNCPQCLECWHLEECFGDGAIQIYRDNHPIVVGDVITIGGVCYSVVSGGGIGCESAIHAVIDFEGFYPDCESCGCWNLVPCPGQAGVDPIVTVGSLLADSAVDALAAGMVVRLDNGNCYTVTRHSGSCTNAVPLLMVQESYSSCEACEVYLLVDCAETSNEITTYEDLSHIPLGSIIKRGEDEKCYLIAGTAPWSTETVETTVEVVYDSECETCISPRYRLTPACSGCACTDAGDSGGSTDGDMQITEQDLSLYVGKLIRYDDICYTVSRVLSFAPADADITLTEPIEVSGPFSDCETCQRQCLWFTVRTRLEGDTLVEDQVLGVVDAVCNTRTVQISETEPCDPDTATN